MTVSAHLRNTVLVDLNALAHNYRELQRKAPHPDKVIAVVKSDAYGHGLVPVSRRLVREGCGRLAVFRLEEAVRLREAGLKVPILVLMGLVAEEVQAALEYDVVSVVYDSENALVLDTAAAKRGRLFRVLGKIDTGMGRLGVPHEEAPRFLSALAELKHVKLDGLITHLSVADEPEQLPFTLEQLNRFRKLLALAGHMGFQLRQSHVANSAACIQQLETGVEWVRVGISLYGSPPSEALAACVPLKPVMSFHSSVIHVKKVPAGTGISYGRTYTTQSESTIATVPVGYDNGYFRSFSDKTEVLIRGIRAPVRGRVCMNLIMADVTHIPHVRPGDPVVLMGSQGNETITAEELARKADTISYEIYTALGKQNSREYLGL